MTSPVLKLISNFDDYFSWFVTILPLVTGLLIPVRMGFRYEDLTGDPHLDGCHYS